MNVSSADLSSVLNRILDAAADNLRFAKILVQMGLDPNNITYDAIFNRMLEIVLANITLANMFAAGRRRLLRRHAPDADHGAAARRQHGRLRVLRRLRRARRQTSRPSCCISCCSRSTPFACGRCSSSSRRRARRPQGDMSMEWLKPFMTERKYRKGDIAVQKGRCSQRDVPDASPANSWSRKSTSSFRRDALMGELGFLTPDNRRTATIECIEDGQVLTITYERLLEIYFQNPQFGYYFLVLTSQRLLENIARLEAVVAQNKIARESASEGGPRS